MSKNTTIKVSKKTLKKLHKLAGEIAAEKGRRVTLEEALLVLLEEKEMRKNQMVSHEANEDRKELLSLLDMKIEGAGPEDFKEYDFNDL
jgi:predicted transcriptional regulator